MDELRATIHRIVSKGIERGEIRSDVDADAWASVMIAMFEGAIMMSKLYQDPVHIRRAAAFMRASIERDLIP